MVEAENSGFIEFQTESGTRIQAVQSGWLEQGVIFLAPEHSETLGEIVRACVTAAEAGIDATYIVCGDYSLGRPDVLLGVEVSGSALVSISAKGVKVQSFTVRGVEK